MLKGIPEILSPELLKVLCEMGHSDRLVIADGNFPVESMGKNAITIRCDGHGVPEILDAILKLFPLDTYVEHPVNLMEVMPGDDVETPIWDTYKEIVSKHDERGEKAIGNIERFAFYDEAKTAYCIISTSEKALYANDISYTHIHPKLPVSIPERAETGSFIFLCLFYFLSFCGFCHVTSPENFFLRISHSGAHCVIIGDTFLCRLIFK